MNHFHQIAALLERYGLDAMLLTGEANRFYASGFHSAGTDGVALVTRKKAYYFTDSRYTEAAGRCVQGAEIREVGPGRGYAVLLTEALGEQKVCRLGFEEAYMTVLEHERYRKALPCELVPATELLQQLRTVKDAEELDAMVARRTRPLIPSWSPAPTEVCPTVYRGSGPSSGESSSPWTLAAFTTGTVPI